ncbi:MAG TPA: beta-ketoacyl synthase N-terminal-like domain-containing protein, partial [Thermoguttaceae bacterium]|nr:beta-ketoacyl synthase N-terminal-like domain-containing protein [Thermoguttaceae bacterium]
AVLPGALTLEAFWDLLTSGQDPKTDLPEGRWDVDAFCGPEAQAPWRLPRPRGGYVTGFEYDWRKHKIPPKEIAQASPLQFMILDAVDQAIHRAGYHERAFDRERVGVVVGTVFGGDCAAEIAVCLRLPEFQETLADLLRRKGVAESHIAEIAESYGKVLLKHMPILLDETGSFTASALASRITKSFDLMGGAVAVDAGEASSMAALACCVDQLRAGDCDMMICVGGQQDMTPVLFGQWSSAGHFAQGETRSPLDARADGTLPAEGCTALLLKRLSDARRDGDPVFGIIRGIGAATDPSRARAAQLAVARAETDADVSTDDVTLLETTGAGRTEQDASQWHGLAAAYGRSGRGQPVPLGTTVSQLGDLSGASGMALLLKATMEMDTRTMLPEVGLDRPSPQLSRHAAVLRAPSAAQPIAPNREEEIIAGIHCDGDDELAYHVYLQRGMKVKSNTQTGAPAGAAKTAPVATTSQIDRGASPVVHFDATARRRDKMREKAHTEPRTPVPVAAVTAPPKPPVRPVVAAAPAPQPVVTQPEPTHLDPKELETFLVNFVVEHTGYPAEIVELDADLEADLGIDSIKKAQLFGELGEYFDVQPSENLSLDDFPTLRHVLDFLAQSQGGPTSAAPSAASPAPAIAPAPIAPAPSAAVVSSAPATAPSSPSETANSTDSTRLDPKELETFLVNFVVEHTGYPAEIVELDADLEADLGIDSIKKAQLFGELGEYFDVQPSENLSLDDFPTLRHVLDFLIKSQGETASAAVAQPVAAPAPQAVSPLPAQPTPQAEPTNSLDPKELETFLVNFVVEHTGYPAEIVELDADLEADLGIDSIKKAQLFGELGEYFDVQPSENLSLDDFPTLRHVLSFLVAAQVETAP